MSLFPKPETAEQMVFLLMSAAANMLYVEMTAAARRGRLTEHDIGLVERRVRAQALAMPQGVQHEFQTFEAELAFAKAREFYDGFCHAARGARAKEVAGKS